MELTGANETVDCCPNLTSIVSVLNGNSSSSYDELFNDLKRNRTSLIASRYLLALKVLKNLNFYYLGTIAIFGLLGNGYNCVSFLRVKRKLRSPSYYLASLALNDVIFMVILLLLWVNHFDIDLFNRKGLYQTLFYFSSTSSCISAWLVVAFTFERLIVVRYPLKRTKICTVRRAKVIIACITVIALLVQTVALFTTGAIDETSDEDDDSIMASNHTNSTSRTLLNSTGGWSDDFLPALYYQASHIFNIVEAFITLVVPSLTTVVMNGFIIHGLAKFNRTFQAGAINKHRVSASLAKSQRLGNNRHKVNIEMKTIRAVSEGAIRSSQQSNTRFQPKREIGTASGCHSSSNSRSDSSSNVRQRIIQTVAVVENPGRRSPIREDRQLQSTSSSPAAEVLTNERITTSTSNKINSDDLNEHHRTTTSFDRPAIECIPLIHHPQSKLEMDTIQTADTLIQPSRQDEATLEVNDSSTIDLLEIKQVPLQPHQSSIRIRRRNAMRRPSVNNSRSSTEYNITKKLVIISTVHIVLNLPSYAINLKIFIDENITHNTDSTLITWIVQQYVLLLYYTNFAINFLLYSTSSATFHQELFICSWFKKAVPMLWCQVSTL